MFNLVSTEAVKDDWNRRPCNIRHSDKELGTMEYFEEVRSRKYFVEPHILDFADFKSWTGKKVLEIGCGIGTDTMMFARAGAKVAAVDYSEESIKMAKLRAKVFELENKIEFYCCNAEKLSETVPVEKYDLIYSFGVIHHTPNPEKVIEEVKKYMDRGSRLKIMVYNRWSWKATMAQLRHPTWSAHDAIAYQSEAQTGCPVTYSYTTKSIQKLLKGLKITNTFVDHIFPYIVPLYKRYEYKKVWYFRMLPQWLFRALERRLGWHLCVTASLPG